MITNVLRCIFFYLLLEYTMQLMAIFEVLKLFSV